MEALCPTCGTHYSFSSFRARESAVVRCRQCHTEFRASERRISLVENLKPAGTSSENSTLFSLAELTRQANSGRPVAPSVPVSGEAEPSGLIDLASLGRSREATAPGTTYSVEHVAPLGLFTPEKAAPPPRRAPATAIWISGSVVLGALIVAGALVLRRAPAAPAPIAELAPAPAAVAPTATANVVPPAASVASVTSEPKAPARVQSATRTAAPTALRATAAKSATKQSSPAAAAPEEKPAAKKKRSDPCAHCKGDLLCAMQCASK